MNKKLIIKFKVHLLKKELGFNNVKNLFFGDEYINVELNFNRIIENIVLNKGQEYPMDVMLAMMLEKRIEEIYEMGGKHYGYEKNNDIKEELVNYFFRNKSKKEYAITVPELMENPSYNEIKEEIFCVMVDDFLNKNEINKKLTTLKTKSVYNYITNFFTSINILEYNKSLSLFIFLLKTQRDKTINHLESLSLSLGFRVEKSEDVKYYNPKLTMEENIKEIIINTDEIANAIKNTKFDCDGQKVIFKDLFDFKNWSGNKFFLRAKGQKENIVCKCKIENNKKIELTTYKNVDNNYEMISNEEEEELYDLLFK